jgi:hypothetical protein
MLRAIILAGVAGIMVFTSGCDETANRTTRGPLVGPGQAGDVLAHKNYDNISSPLEFDVAGALSGTFGSYLHGSSAETSLSIAAYDGLNDIQLSAYTEGGAAMTWFIMTDSLLATLVPGADITFDGDELGYDEDLEVIGCTGPELGDWTEDYEATSVDFIVEPHPDAPHVSLVTFTTHFDPEIMKARTLRQEREYIAEYESDYQYGGYDDYGYDDYGYDGYVYREMTDEEILDGFDFPHKPMHISGSFLIVRQTHDLSTPASTSRAIN